MRKSLLAGVAFAALTLCPADALAQYAGTFGGIPISASSGNVAAGVATATLAANGNVNKTTHICGFSITSSGSTGAAVVSPTVTNVVTGTMTYTYATVAGVTLANSHLNVTFNPCLPANAPNTTIIVSMPSLGAGNTNATVNAWGFQY